MPLYFSLLNEKPYIELPQNILGWLGFFGMLILLAWGIRKWWEPIHVIQKKRWWVFIFLMIITPLTLLLAIRISSLEGLPLPNIPGDTSIPVIIPLFAIPWVLSAGLLGLAPTVVLGLISGLLLAAWKTHTPFAILEIAGLALIYSALVRQIFRTRFYKILRHPLGAGISLAVLSLPIFMIVVFFATNGSLAVRLDYAFSQMWDFYLMRVFEIIIAGLIGEGLFLTGRGIWYRPTMLKPSPIESSLQWRFLFTLTPLVVGGIVFLVLCNWWVAEKSARQVIQDRLKGTAEIAVESLPYFLETGQNLILNMAKPDLLGDDPTKVYDGLGYELRTIPFFREMMIFNSTGNWVNGYPSREYKQISLTQSELDGVNLALKGALIQTYAIPPKPGEDTAQISFLAVIRDVNGGIGGVLLGRTDINSNPFTQPAIQALKTVHSNGGEGVIIDENHSILFHTASGDDLVMKSYEEKIPMEAEFFDDLFDDGTRRLVYYQPSLGRPWGVIVSVPAEQAHELALKIAIPLLIILLVFTVISYFIIRFTLRSLTVSLKRLVEGTTKITHGQLDSPIPMEGVDEIGQLGSAFEQMRIGLKTRLDELNRLLVVSEGVASNLDIGGAISPILQAALGTEASSARVVLIRDVVMDPLGDSLVAFGSGKENSTYAFLDTQIFELARQQNFVIIPNLHRARRLIIQAGMIHPGSLIALPLYHEEHYYGVLWVAFESPRNFTDEFIRFISTLAGEAAIAAANARLYVSAEIGRQRLVAVLASTPEPVLVFDEQERLLLVNTSGLQVPGLLLESTPGLKLEEVIRLPELLELIRSPMEEKITTREITLPGGKIYSASVSPVIAEGRQVGKICVMRDITHYKELDTIKTDFVATVSHDLRSPMTLMRGHITMLQMVGELNEQQKVYIRKLVGGLDHITRMVNNLLDLGRIEAGIDLRLEQVSAVGIVEQVINLLQPQATQKNIQLLFYPPESKNISVTADQALLQQALNNVVENAIKYTPLGGRVKIQIVEKPSSIIFEINDTGIGIAPIDLPRLFEKFYRSGRREAYQQRGTGLGLAIVKSIVERHHGRVWVESQLGKGSTFYLEIPLQGRNESGIIGNL